jgi:hypothetical protein
MMGVMMYDPLGLGPVEGLSMTAEEQRELIEKTKRDLPVMAATVDLILARRRRRRIEERRRRGLPPLAGDVAPPMS